eukprot:TRINITY_DN533_c0_g1_i1.p1 TRINITY_DN533_c0_g1~~TRINITY_DN533_c0_g1_i1.p1  ORF type:complete len:650 (+),score=150.88 TRINITY_DN533_c0_g1_i1:101-1951(+)
MGKQLCYVVFDLLFVNGKSVMDLTLSQRTHLLSRCIPKQTPHTLELAERVPVSSTSDIITALDNAIINREEGIMVKDCGSTYIPNERKEKWIKLKPEYIDGVVDDLDLLIVGGYYGTGIGRRGGTISHFMLAVKAPPSHTAGGGSQEPVFWSFCKVGSGYSDSELKELQTQLHKHWRVFDTERPPPFLKLAPPFREKPDVYIQPRNSIILQVRAAQIVPSEKFKVGHTLRFPRVHTTRVDKGWDEGMTHADLLHIVNQYQSRAQQRLLATALALDGDNPLEFSNLEAADAVRKRTRTGGRSSSVKRAHTVMKQYQAIDTSNLAVTDEIFGAMEFCVMNGSDECPKQEIEKKIFSLGGVIVQAPIPSTHCLVAARLSLKVKNVVETRDVDVILPRWVEECLEQKRFLSLEPKYMLHTSARTHDRFRTFIDPYGDHYSEEATRESLSAVFSSMEKYLQEEDHEDAPPTTEKEKEAEKRMRGVDAVAYVEAVHIERPWWGVFRGYTVYLDLYAAIGDRSTEIADSPLQLTRRLLAFYGASVTHHITPGSALTHVVLHSENLSRLSLLRTAVKRCLEQPPHLAVHVVTHRWVHECHQAREDLDEREFYPPAVHSKRQKIL